MTVPSRTSPRPEPLFRAPFQQKIQAPAPPKPRGLDPPLEYPEFNPDPQHTLGPTEPPPEQLGQDAEMERFGGAVRGVKTCVSTNARGVMTGAQTKQAPVMTPPRRCHDTRAGGVTRRVMTHQQGVS